MVHLSAQLLEVLEMLQTYIVDFDWISDVLLPRIVDNDLVGAPLIQASIARELVVPCMVHRLLLNFEGLAFVRPPPMSLARLYEHVEIVLAVHHRLAVKP